MQLVWARSGGGSNAAAKAAVAAAAKAAAVAAVAAHVSTTCGRPLHAAVHTHTYQPLLSYSICFRPCCICPCCAGVQEKEPMGTAGPLALARHLLDDGSGKPFFVLNSDVVCPYPMKDMLDFHTARGAEATILVTKVDDPSKYGECKGEQGRVERHGGAQPALRQQLGLTVGGQVGAPGHPVGCTKAGVR